MRGVNIIPHFNEFPALVLSGLPLLAMNHVLVGIAAEKALVCSRDGFSVRGSGGVTLGLGNDRQRFSQKMGGLKSRFSFTVKWHMVRFTIKKFS